MRTKRHRHVGDTAKLTTGSLLWNFPEKVTIVGFIDNLAVIVSATDPKNMEIYAAETVIVIKTWLDKAGLTLAD